MNKKLVTIRIPKLLNKFYDEEVKKINIKRKLFNKKEITKTQLLNFIISDLVFNKTHINGEFNNNYQLRFYYELKNYDLDLKNDKQISFYITENNHYMINKFANENGENFTENLRHILIYYFKNPSTIHKI